MAKKSLMSKFSDTIVELKDRIIGLEKQMQDYAFGTTRSAKTRTKRAATRGKTAVKKAARTTKAKAKVRRVRGR